MDTFDEIQEFETRFNSGRISETFSDQGLEIEQIVDQIQKEAPRLPDNPLPK